MRSEEQVKKMLETVESRMDDEYNDDEVEAIRDTLEWVLSDYLSDERVTNYLPAP